jgi:hypothetical protein
MVNNIQRQNSEDSLINLPGVSPDCLEFRRFGTRKE